MFQRKSLYLIEQHNFSLIRSPLHSRLFEKILNSDMVVACCWFLFNVAIRGVKSMQYNDGCVEYYRSGIVGYMLANLMYHFDWELPAEMEAAGAKVDMKDQFGMMLHRTEKLLLVPRIFKKES